MAGYFLGKLLNNCQADYALVVHYPCVSVYKQALTLISDLVSIFERANAFDPVHRNFRSVGRRPRQAVRVYGASAHALRADESAQ